MQFLAQLHTILRPPLCGPIVQAQTRLAAAGRSAGPLSPRSARASARASRLLASTRSCRGAACHGELEWQQFLSLEGQTWFARDPEAVKQRRRAALDIVLEYRRLKEEAYVRSGYGAAGDLADELGQRFCDAEGDLVRTPAPTPPHCRGSWRRCSETSTQTAIATLGALTSFVSC